MKNLMDKIVLPSDRFEMRLSGSGGQGMVLAAVIFSEAIGFGTGKNVAQTQSYGPEARGGASKSDVVVSPSEIFYPKAIKLDLLLAMTQEALDSYFSALKDHGILIIDDVLVTHVPTDDYYGLSFTRLAREECGHIMVANVIAVAAIAEITGLVGRDALEQAVLARAPRGTEEKNKKAIEVGFREAARLKAQRKKK
jgi:2-oxoglutarate ferredoxin oxidoreductase subunit gamma